MQEWWRGWWRAQADDKPSPAEIPNDFGWYDESAIRRWGIHYFLSGYNPGHLPREGGVMALTESEWNDLMQLMLGTAWARYEKHSEQESKRIEDKMMLEDYTK